jgi:hypothetical protein
LNFGKNLTKLPSLKEYAEQDSFTKPGWQGVALMPGFTWVSTELGYRALYAIASLYSRIRISVLLCWWA